MSGYGCTRSGLTAGHGARPPGRRVPRETTWWSMPPHSALAGDSRGTSDRTGGVAAGARMRRTPAAREEPTVRNRTQRLSSYAMVLAGLAGVIVPRRVAEAMGFRDGPGRGLTGVRGLGCPLRRPRRFRAHHRQSDGAPRRRLRVARRRRRQDRRSGPRSPRDRPRFLGLLGAGADRRDAGRPAARPPVIRRRPSRHGVVCGGRS